jgi:hypothetical protein
LSPGTTACRAAAGPCDETEFCTGTTPACPADAFSPPSTVCRPNSGQCDVAESCSGSSAACPADAHQPDGTACNDGLFCTGPNGDTCTGGVCSGPPNTCNDGNSCSQDVCNEDTNQCEHTSQIPACEGKMTGGGQIQPNRTNKNDKRSFGANAQGQALAAPGSPGGPKGHFNYVNHGTGVKIEGPVTFIYEAVPTETGGRMKFEVTTSAGCKYNVTMTDNAEPGSKSPYDNLKLEYVSGSCPVENTGDQQLTAGNNQWHNQ